MVNYCCTEVSPNRFSSQRASLTAGSPNSRGKNKNLKQYHQSGRGSDFVSSDKIASLPRECPRAMPFIQPVATTRNQARYKTIDVSEDFVLQQHRYSLRKSKHPYWVRIITRATKPRFKVAQAWSEEKIRAREWKYITEDLTLPAGLQDLQPGHETRTTWLLSRLVQVMRQIGDDKAENIDYCDEEYDDDIDAEYDGCEQSDEFFLDEEESKNDPLLRRRSLGSEDSDLFSNTTRESIGDISREDACYFPEASTLINPGPRSSSSTTLTDVGDCQGGLPPPPRTFNKGPRLGSIVRRRLSAVRTRQSEVPSISSTSTSSVIDDLLGAGSSHALGESSPTSYDDGDRLPDAPRIEREVELESPSLADHFSDFEGDKSDEEPPQGTKIIPLDRDCAITTITAATTSAIVLEPEVPNAGKMEAHNLVRQRTSNSRTKSSVASLSSRVSSTSGAKIKIPGGALLSTLEGNLPSYLTIPQEPEESTEARGRDKREAVTMERLKREHEHRLKVAGCILASLVLLIFRAASFDAFIVLLILFNIGVCYVIQHRHDLMKRVAKSSIKRRVKFTKQIWGARLGVSGDKKAKQTPAPSPAGPSTNSSAILSLNSTVSAATAPSSGLFVPQANRSASVTESPTSPKCMPPRSNSQPPLSSVMSFFSESPKHGQNKTVKASAGSSSSPKHSQGRPRTASAIFGKPFHLTIAGATQGSSSKS